MGFLRTSVLPVCAVIPAQVSTILRISDSIRPWWSLCFVELQPIASIQAGSVITVTANLLSSKSSHTIGYLQDILQHRLARTHILTYFVHLRGQSMTKCSVNQPERENQAEQHSSEFGVANGEITALQVSRVLCMALFCVRNLRCDFKNGYRNHP